MNSFVVGVGVGVGVSMLDSLIAVRNELPVALSLTVVVEAFPQGVSKNWLVIQRV
jgi:hypothetical protein